MLIHQQSHVAQRPFQNVWCITQTKHMFKVAHVSKTQERLEIILYVTMCYSLFNLLFPRMNAGF